MLKMQLTKTKNNLLQKNNKKGTRFWCCNGDM